MGFPATVDLLELEVILETEHEPYFVFADDRQSVSNTRDLSEVGELIKQHGDRIFHVLAYFEDMIEQEIDHQRSNQLAVARTTWDRQVESEKLVFKSLQVNVCCLSKRHHLVSHPRIELRNETGKHSVLKICFAGKPHPAFELHLRHI
ncbi:MAG: hypothetical protein BWY75_00122 [bacterium ADurb.Bin425]|nr:MAG: hypothetical protein BWY75_00122 [bacterium ADurb.Bin425]